jgi:hypothetical protein
MKQLIGREGSNLSGEGVEQRGVGFLVHRLGSRGIVPRSGSTYDCEIGTRFGADGWRTKWADRV